MTDPIAATKADYDAALERIEAGRRMIAEGKAARDAAAGVLCLDLGVDPTEVRRLLGVGLDQVERMVQSARWARAREEHLIRIANTPSKVTCMRCFTVVLASDMDDHDRLHASG